MVLYDELHPAVKKILNFIEDLTGKGFEFLPNSKMVEYAGVKIARSSMANHLLIYQPEHNKLINHLIAHECGHIMRIYQMEPSKRKVPGVTNEEKRKSLTPLQDQIYKLSSAIGEDKTIQITNMLYDGIVRQVTNQPVDLMIEKWIYEEYPELQQIQLDSLIHQNKLGLEGITNSAKKLIPPFFFKRSAMMNAAYTDLLSKIVRFKLVRDWKRTEFFDESKLLSEILDTYIGWLPERDYGKVDAWSELLDIEGFFRWIPFEEMPEDYLTQNTGV